MLHRSCSGWALGRRVSLVVAALFCAGMVSGCISFMQHRKEKLPPGARVGVLVSTLGGTVIPTIGSSYIEAAVAKSGLTPAALHEAPIPLHSLITSLQSTDKVSEDWIRDRPNLLPSIQRYLQEHRVEYLLVVAGDNSGFDEDLRMLLVRSADLEVVGSYFYRMRIMVPLFLAPPGFSLLWVPWFYMRTAEGAFYDRIVEFLTGVGEG